MKTLFDTKLGVMLSVSRIGLLCCGLAIVTLTAGCPFNPCFNVNCDDEDPCTQDTCAGGECSNEPIEDCCEVAADCNDNNACTIDACSDIDADTGAGTCVNTAVGQNCCNDNTECDEGEVCVGNQCVPEGEGCDEDDDCPEGETCNLATGECEGVEPECVDNADCADGDDCTINTCVDGACVSEDVVCDEGDVCVGGVCVAVCTTDDDCVDDGDLCTTETCVNGGCVTADVVCDEGDLCNPDTGECEPEAPECLADVDCDDADDCTDDTCVDGACVFTNNTGACSDGNACTTNDTCTDGACVGTPVTCPPGQTCNTSTGNCQAITCTSNADCNDGFSCTTDTCNLATGACVYTNIDAACEDNLFCTGVGEVCDPTNNDAEAGTGCVRPGNPCANPTPICQESNDTCVACENNAQCNDGFSCTSDTCTGGSCINTQLNTSCPDPLKCDGDDICDPNHPDADDTTGCYPPGNPCAPRVCDEATYVVGDPNTCENCTSNTDCSDGITCTQDICDGGTGNCSNNTDDALCPDPLFCDGDDVCDPNDPDSSPTTGCVNGLLFGGYPCANACNEATNTCFNCTGNIDCSDGIACTTDACDGNTGLCSHTDNCNVGVCNLQSGQCD